MHIEDSSMTTDIENLKGAIRFRLRQNFNQVPSPRSTSKKKHLEVWTSKRSSRVVGIEFDHADRINIWVTVLGMPRALPTTIQRTDKEPIGTGWSDVENRGANSNLSAYKHFTGRRIARLGVTNLDDAVLILDHLSH